MSKDVKFWEFFGFGHTLRGAISLVQDAKKRAKGCEVFGEFFLALGTH